MAAKKGFVGFEAMQVICDRLAKLEANSSPPTQLDVCTNLRLPFTSNPSGWWAAWTATATANVNNETAADWRTIATRVNLTDKVVDMDLDVNLGNHYIYSRRTRTYLWADVQLLVNGAVVLVRNSVGYWYQDERSATQETAEPQQVRMQTMGEALAHRYDIPVGAVVEVQVRSRRTVTAVQSSGWARYIGGIRSNATINWFLQNVVVGEL